MNKAMLTYNKDSVKEVMWDYAKILTGLALYAIGYTVFMLPYNITSGGVSGISALIFYATDFPAYYSYLIINVGLLLMSMKIMGWRYTLRTIIATLIISFLIGYIQDLITKDDGSLMQIIGEQKFLACVIGGLMEGLGLAVVFMAGGSTGGTDVIASCINKYWNISLGRLLLYLDIVIVSCNFLIFHNWETLVIGYVTMFISMNFLDYVINGARQSVQFTIISNHHEEIAQAVCDEIDRGVTILHGEGWYSKEKRQVLLIMAKKQESRQVFHLIHRIDPKAFVTMSNVEGVFGEGFDKIKK